MTKLTAEQNELLDLRDRVYELEEEVRQLRKLLAGEARFPIEWKLQPGEAKLLSSLAAAPQGYRSREALCRIISKLDDPQLTLVAVRISNLRRKLKPLGISILTRSHDGYELPPASRRALSALLDAHQ